jgi:ribonuclease HII
MKKVAGAYPLYGFESHVGYGTKAHYDAIKKYGTTPLHRKSFLTKMK